MEALSSGVGLGKIEGGVDARGRPVVRIAFFGVTDDILALVDTGFNGQLMLSESDASSHGIQSTGVYSSAELASGEVRQIGEARAVVQWMGEQRRVEVLLSAQPLKRGADEPIALIGT